MSSVIATAKSIHADTNLNLNGINPFAFYELPSWFTTELLRHLKIFGVVGEPCVGKSAIATILKAWPHTDSIWTNDIDPNQASDFHYDATVGTGYCG
jgi:hypothetical protein